MPSFPSGLDSLSNPTPTTRRNDVGFELSTVISTLNDIVEALETKLGIGASAPTNAGDVLKVTAAGATAFGPGGLARLAQTVLGATAATIPIASIPGTYESLMLVVQARGTQTAAQIELQARFNGDGSGNYLVEQVHGQGTTVAATEVIGANQMRLGYIPGASATANLFGVAKLTVPGYARTVAYKAMLADGAEAHAFTAGTVVRSSISGFWLNTAAITSITLLPSAGSFAAGSVATLYGMP